MNSETIAAEYENVPAAFLFVLKTIASDEFRALPRDAGGRQARRDMIRTAAAPFWAHLYAIGALDKPAADCLRQVAYFTIQELLAADYPVHDWFDRTDPAPNGERWSWGLI